MRIIDHQFLQNLEDLVSTAIAEGVELDTIRWGLENYGLDLEGWQRELMEEMVKGERQAAAEAEPIKDYADKHGE